MPRIRCSTRATWLAPLLVASAFLANCSSADPVSLGNAHAGSGNTGLGTAGSSSAGSSSAGSSSAGSSSAGSPGAAGGGGTSGTCATSDCGPPLGGSAGSAGASGQAAGGATDQLCGGQVCGADQACCGPAACGHCISKFSGQNCPAQCSGGSGGTGVGGASGGAGGADCTSLLANVQSTLATAQACNMASAKPTPECAGTLEGLCCPVLVEAAPDSNDPANTAYLNALHAYQQNCTHVCPKIACFMPQPGNCVAASGSTLGTCGG